MSKTLSLVDHLRHRGRSLHKLGLDAQALDAWHRLADIQDLPEDVAAESQERLAELAFALGRYDEARRRIRIVLMRSPEHPYWHFLLAQTIERDPNRDIRLALRHYVLATEYDPDQAQYWAELARCADRCGDADAAEAAAAHALSLEPDRYETVAPVATMRCRQGRFAEARDVLRVAMFRNPGEPRFRRRLDRIAFDESSRERTVDADDPILPFLVPIDALRRRRERKDPPHPSAPAHRTILPFVPE